MKLPIMNRSSLLRRARAPRQSRGQMIILGAVSLLVLALIVFITFNVTVAVQQRIKLQNYSDTKAFSLAVAEARTLNYLAYTNRAIASAYVGMANVSAYMSEAAMLTDLKMGGAVIMGQIAALEYAQCMCCCTPFGCAPCCFNHCVDAFEAGLNAVGLFMEVFSGDMANRVQKLDAPATSAVNALNNHINMLRLSQIAARGAMSTLLLTGNFGDLKKNNMQKADTVTTDVGIVNAANVALWNKVFNDSPDVKKKVMTSIVNASRPNFTWNRAGPDSLPITPTAPILFPTPQLSSRVKASMWTGPTGIWNIIQSPDLGFMAGGRTGARTNAFSSGFGGDVSNNAAASMMSSVDWGTLSGVWKHGAGASTLPLLGPIAPGNLSIGQSGSRHTGGLFGSPHSGSNHGQNLDFSRFQEFDPGTSFPFNQPYVYAAATTDSRVNEYGQRGPWEVAKDGSGTITVKNVGPQDAKLTLSNNNRSKAFSKAMVYYHRIGDWSDYPNLFNPYWRAKLQPVTPAEVGTVLAGVDTQAATVVGGSIGINKGAVNVE